MIVPWTNKGQFLIEKKHHWGLSNKLTLKKFWKTFSRNFSQEEAELSWWRKKTHKKESTDDDFSLSPNFYFLPVSLSIIFATKYSRPFDEIFWPLSLSALPLPVAACPWKNIFCTLISWLFVSWQVTWALAHAFFLFVLKKQNHVKLEKWMWREWKQSKVCRKCHNSNKQTLTWVQK